MKLISAKFFGWYYIATRRNSVVDVLPLNSEARKYAAYTEKTLSVIDSGDNRKLSYVAESYSLAYIVRS